MGATPISWDAAALEDVVHLDALYLLLYIEEMILCPLPIQLMHLHIIPSQERIVRVFITRAGTPPRFLSAG